MYTIFIAIGCIWIGYSHFKKGISDNGELSKKEKYFYLIFGGIMAILGMLNILKLLSQLFLS